MTLWKLFIFVSPVFCPAAATDDVNLLQKKDAAPVESLWVPPPEYKLCKNISRRVPHLVSWRGFCETMTESRGKRNNQELRQLYEKSVLFYGDDDMEYWDTERGPGVRRSQGNCGVAGAVSREAARYAGNTSRRYKPRSWVVMTIGEVDLISFDHTPPCISGVQRNMEDAAMKFLDRMYLGRGAQGRVVYFGMKPAPRTRPWHPKFREYDSRIQNMLLNDVGRWGPRLTMIDRFTQFMNLGNPQNFYTADGVHLSAQGYAWMNEALRQVIMEVRQTDFLGGDSHAKGDIPHHAGPPAPSASPDMAPNIGVNNVETDSGIILEFVSECKQGKTLLEEMMLASTPCAERYSAHTPSICKKMTDDPLNYVPTSDEEDTLAICADELADAAPDTSRMLLLTDAQRQRKMEIEKMDEQEEEEIEDLPNAVEPSPLDYNGMTVVQKLAAHEEYLRNNRK